MWRSVRYSPRPGCKYPHLHTRVRKWGQWKGWIERGCYQPWQAWVGTDHLGQFNADRGRDWTGIPIRASNNRTSKHFFTSLSSYLSSQQEKCMLCIYSWTVSTDTNTPPPPSQKHSLSLPPLPPGIYQLVRQIKMWVGGGGGGWLSLFTLNRAAI